MTSGEKRVVCGGARPRSNLININTYLPELVEYLDVVNLATYLLAVDLITHEERKAILGLETKHHQVPELMRLLQTKGGDWYARFRFALLRATDGSQVHLGHKNLVEDILPESLEEHPKSCKYDSQQERLEPDVVMQLTPNDSEFSTCECFRVLKAMHRLQQSCVGDYSQRGTSRISDSKANREKHGEPLELTSNCAVSPSHSHVQQLKTGRSTSFMCAPKQSDLLSGSCCNRGDGKRLTKCRNKEPPAAEVRDCIYARNNLDIEDEIRTEPSCDSGLSPRDRACGQSRSTACDSEDSVSEMVGPYGEECQKILKEAACGVTRQVQGLQTEKRQLKRENEKLRGENEDLRRRLEALEKQLAEQGSDQERRSQKRREQELELELQRARVEEGMEQFARQQILQSARLEDVQSLKSMPQELAAKLCCKRQKGPVLKHLKLLVLGDFRGTSHETWAWRDKCSHTVDALLGHPQDLWEQDSPDHKLREKGVVRTHCREKLHADCNVRVTTIATDLSDSNSLSSTVSPDLVLLCLEDWEIKHQESLLRLTTRLSPAVWERCVVVVHPRAGEQDCLQLKKGFLEALKCLGVSPLVYGKIPFMIVPDATSTHPCWVSHCLAEFYTACVERAPAVSRSTLVQLNRLRLKPSGTVDYPSTQPPQPRPLSQCSPLLPLPLTQCRMERLQKAVAGDTRLQCCLKVKACKLTAPFVGKLCRRECKN